MDPLAYFLIQPCSSRGRRLCRHRQRKLRPRLARPAWRIRTRELSDILYCTVSASTEAVLGRSCYGKRGSTWGRLFFFTTHNATTTPHVDDTVRAHGQGLAGQRDFRDRQHTSIWSCLFVPAKQPVVRLMLFTSSNTYRRHMMSPNLFVSSDLPWHHLV